MERRPAQAQCEHSAARVEYSMTCSSKDGQDNIYITTISGDGIVGSFPVDIDIVIPGEALFNK